MVGLWLGLALYLTIRVVVDKSWRAYLKTGSGMLVGAVGVLLVVVGLFALQGALAAMWDAAIRFSTVYSETQWTSWIRSIWTGLTILSQSGIVFMALVGWLIGAVYAQREEIAPATRRLIMAAMIALPLDLAVATMSGRSYEHYYITWLPSMTVLASVFVHMVIDAIQPQRDFTVAGRVITFASVLSAALVLASIGVPLIGRIQQLESSIINRDAVLMNEAESTTLARYIIEQTDENDHVFFLGVDPVVYFLSNRPTAGRFTYMEPLFQTGYVTGDRVREYIAEIEANQPALLVIKPGNRFIGEDGFVVPPDPNVSYTVLPEHDLIFRYIDDHFEFKETIADHDIYVPAAP